jgi:hypothetical protein
MNRREIVLELKVSYMEFMAVINDMTEAEYTYQFQDKWSAAHQLEHIVLCVEPLVQVYGMNPTAIEQMFGKTDRPNKSYEDLKDLYISKLQGGGKAPDSFLPKVQLSREELIYTLHQLIEEFQQEILALDENELETILIPHPLMELITLKEMAYNAIYHVQHHQALMMQYLNQR